METMNELIRKFERAKSQVDVEKILLDDSVKICDIFANWHFLKQIKFSKKFYRKFSNKIDWYEESKKNSRLLPISIIREFKNKVYWPHICKYRRISVKFVEEFYP